LLSRRVNGPGVIIGLLAGFCGNLGLWKFAPNISWLWWNVIGFWVAYAIGFFAAGAFSKPAAVNLAGTLIWSNSQWAPKSHTKWRRYYLVLAAYGIGILAFLICITIAVRLGA
jgi:SSS family solute:Na+ symporter